MRSGATTPPSAQDGAERVLAVIGLAISVPVALGTSRFIGSFLFGMKPNDPVALGLAVMILLLAAPFGRGAYRQGGHPKSTP